MIKSWQVKVFEKIEIMQGHQEIKSIIKISLSNFEPLAVDAMQFAVDIGPL